jgi:hypothetical protein
MISLVRIQASQKKDKKWTAVFEMDNKILKYVSFGSKGYSDYTMHRDAERKQNYLNRHATRENWNDPTSPGALSRWILWNKPSFLDSVKDFKRRFHL